MPSQVWGALLPTGFRLLPELWAGFLMTGVVRTAVLHNTALQAPPDSASVAFGRWCADGGAPERKR